MKTSCELEKKLKKLPAFIKVDNEEYHLKILKDKEYFDVDMFEYVWTIEYCDFQLNTILSVQHKSIQAAIDTTLAELKRIN